MAIFRPTDDDRDDAIQAIMDELGVSAEVAEDEYERRCRLSRDMEEEERGGDDEEVDQFFDGR